MVHQKCNPSFQSQFCYLDNQSISITDYLNNRDSYSKHKVCCNKGHELVAVNCESRKKHFRHKNSSDMEGHPMSAWHAEWQGHFPETEITYKCKDFNQVSERRADVVLNDTTILELQHSLISPAEVFSRKNDYSIHGKSIIWVIDGNQGIEVKELPGSNRCFLYFSSDNWRYKSFNKYKAIYIDIQDKIYKVFPNLIKSDMTDVSEPKSKQEFIEALNTSKNLWDDTEPPQCELLVKQQGAGNGKTFGIIQNIKDPAFSHYETFIYVTKQHSAKYTMFKELREQINGTDKLLPQFEEYETKDISDKNDPKKFIYEFTHKETNDKKQLIFATIDSFMHSVGQRDEQAYDTFLGIVNNINKDNDDESTMKIENSSIHFAKKRRKLNKKTIFIVDECQDLDINYARAIVKIMRTTYMDCLVVGDILQSIQFETNAFSFFMSDINDNEIMPFINRSKLTPTNICQRFKRNELVDFVNKVVNFNYNNMNLPPVTAASPEENAETSIHFFKADGIGNDDDELLEEDITQHMNMEKNLEIIMDLFQKEVFENDRKPNDFLLVTPFTSNNLLAKELELQIHLFWEHHLKDVTTDFCKYAVFHRSQEGTSINLDESLHATRIVSCHSAKGDGRNVVFLVGFTEKTINIFSKRTNSLIFESMVNVAMTRMKQKLYIQYTPNGDILHKRYYQYCCSIEKKVNNIIPILPNINKFLYVSKLVDYFDGEENWNFFKPILAKAKITSLDNQSSNKQIIDMGHHSIRAFLMDMRFMISIAIKERTLLSQDDFRKKQQVRIFEDIGKSSVGYCEYYHKYNSDLAALSKKRGGEKGIFPLLRLRGKTKEGKYYYEVLNKFMLNMIQYTDDLVKGRTNRLPCPLESLILYFMKEQLRKGWRADISIFFIYDILDKYEHGFQHSEIHSECPCNAFFKDIQLKPENKSLDVFHVGFYNKLQRVDEHLSELYTNNPKLTWLSNHDIYYNSGNNDFALHQEIKYHAYDDDKREVVLCYLKPQHNALNEKDTYMKILMDTWLILNCKQEEKNILKYSGKKIKACILSLDSDLPLYIDAEDIAREYNSDIYQLVFDRWTQLLTRTNDAVFYFYNFYRKKMISQKKSTTEFCKELHKKIKEACNDEYEVKFIRDFFIGDLLIDNNNLPATIKDAILKEYDDKEKFTNSLRERIVKDLAEHLQIEFEEEA